LQHCAVSLDAIEGCPIVSNFMNSFHAAFIYEK
jgi:hypothetical protein